MTEDERLICPTCGRTGRGVSPQSSNTPNYTCDICQNLWVFGGPYKTESEEE